jgi:hypothetical protein
MTQFTTTITAMYTLQQPDPNYVVNVLWTLTGVDGTTTASIGGNTMFDSNQSGTFIPYDQLTEALVIGWVQAALGEQGISNFEACVQGQINSILNPPVSPENTPLPWAAA